MYRSEEAIVQNLVDAGCSPETIGQFAACRAVGARERGLQVLALHRRELLDRLHLAQRQIDCLDYLVFQLSRETPDEG